MKAQQRKVSNDSDKRIPALSASPMGFRNNRNLIPGIHDLSCKKNPLSIDAEPKEIISRSLCSTSYSRDATGMFLLTDERTDWTDSHITNALGCFLVCFACLYLRISTVAARRAAD